MTAVRFWTMGDVTRVVVEVNTGFHYRSDRLSNPERLFFDILGAKPEMVRKGMYSIPVDDALLKKIRLAETQVGVTRVVLDLAQHAEVTASQLSNPDRLIIELRPKAPPTAAIAPGPASQAAPDAAADLPGDVSHDVGHLVVPPVFGTQGEPRTSPAALSAVNPPSPTMPANALPSATTAAASVPPIAPLAKEPVRKPITEHRKFVPPPARVDVAQAPVKSDLYLPPPPTSVAARPLRSPSLPSPLRKDLPPPPIEVAMLTKPDIGRTPALDAAPVLDPVATDRAVSLKVDRAVSPLPAAKGTASPGTEKEALPARRNMNGDRSMARALGLKLGRVVLDPGHGGHDVGTHGPSGLYEKDVVLDIAQRLGALIEERMGSEVIYTRSDDTYIPLEERTQIANDHKADLFLSIHANSSPIRSAAGVETYVLSFTTSKTAMDLASRENAGSNGTLYDLHELLQKIALRDKVDESREFALRLQTSLYSVSAKSNAAARDRGVKKAPFVVLIGATMPSVLAEIGFLTNSGDEALLRRPDHRQKIAEALYKGIAAYADTLSHFQVAKRD